MGVGLWILWNSGTCDSHKTDIGFLNSSNGEDEDESDINMNDGVKLDEIISEDAEIIWTWLCNSCSPYVAKIIGQLLCWESNKITSTNWYGSCNWVDFHVEAIKCQSIFIQQNCEMNQTILY